MRPRISVGGDVRGHVCMSGLCSWFRITVSRNSCSACVNRPAGVSLARGTHGGCMPAAVRVSVHSYTGV